MSDFQKGKIYKIISSNSDSVYIGSTVQKLNQRLNEHVCLYTNEIVKCGDYKIILIELYPCVTRDELLKREQYWIDNSNVVNKKKAYNPTYIKDYYNNNKEKEKIRSKIYKELNKEKIKIKRAKRILCDICNKEIQSGNKARHQQSKKCMKYKNI